MVFFFKKITSINLLQTFNESEDSCNLFAVIRACRLAAVGSNAACDAVRATRSCEALT